MNLRALPIGPAEAFVLSRIDGVSTETDIIAATGLDAESVLAALRRLAALNAIEYPGRSAEGHAPPARTSVELEQRTIARDAPAPLDAPSGVFPAEEIEEDVDLSRTRRLCVLELFYRLDELDHYELLGLPRDADRQAEKDAYYSVVGLFHPDRYYGKRLGRYKPKLEAVFARLTEAHETLSRNRARHDYDEILVHHTAPFFPAGRAELLERLHALIRSEARSGRPARAQQDASETPSSRLTQRDSAPGGTVPTGPPLPNENNAVPTNERSSLRRGEESPAGPTAVIQGALSASSAIPVRVVQDSAGPGNPEAAGSQVARISHHGAPARTSETPHRANVPAGASLAPAERTKALARSLRPSVPPSPPPSPTADPITLHAAGVADELRNQFVRRTSATRLTQAKRHVEAAHESAGAGRWMAAANSMRLAAAIAPDDEEIFRKLREFELRSSRELRDSYIDHAREAERNGQLAEAATFYERAARSSPTPSILIKSAQCLLAANTELKKAANLAKHALSLNDGHVEAHVTLAKIYVAAGMRTSAVFELERASTLTPNDASIKDLLKQLKRNAS